MATPGTGQVALDWNSNTEPDLARYHVYHRVSGQTGYDAPIRVTSSAYTQTGLASDITHIFSVTAVDVAGHESAAPRGARDARRCHAGPVTDVLRRILPPADGGSFWGAWIGEAVHGHRGTLGLERGERLRNRELGVETRERRELLISLFASYCGGSGWWPRAHAVHGDTDPARCRSSRGTLRRIPRSRWQRARSTRTSGSGRRRQGLGPPFFLRFCVGDERRVVSLGCRQQRRDVRGVRGDVAPRARHLRERGCDERDLGLVPEHRRRRTLAGLSSVYPGASYVDWTCLDGYNGNNPWRSFVDLYRATYDRVVALAPDKPMIVGEIGSTESGGSKAQWIADMFAALPTHFPAIRGLMWFDKVESGPGGYSDWRLESSTMSSAAFAHGIAATRFKSDEYAALP